MGDIKETQNNDYLLNLNMDNASDEEIIEWLCKIISNELEKPEEEVDNSLILECSDYLKELLPESEKHTDEELKTSLAALKAKVAIETSDISSNNLFKETKKHKRVAIKSFAIIAAVFTSMFVMLSIAAVSNGYSNAWEYVSAKASVLFNMNPGDKIEENVITLIKNNESKIYNNIEELLVAEGLSFMYPTILPDNVKINKIIMTKSADSETYTVHLKCSDERISVIVRNYHSIDIYTLQNSTVYEVNSHKYYISTLEDNSYQAICQENGFEYRIITHDYNYLIIIINYLKGIKK